MKKRVCLGDVSADNQDDAECGIRLDERKLIYYNILKGFVRLQILQFVESDERAEL